MTAKAKTILFLLCTALLIMAAGCAKQHTVKINDNFLVFHYRDSEAKEILLAASPDNFKYHPAQKVKKDLWVVQLPWWNEFSYFYVVDGQIRLPDCPNTIFDDFGGKNCFFIRPM